MNARATFISLSFVLAAALGPGGAAGPAGDKAAPSSPGRLIRLDLLENRGRTAAVIRRDLFVPFSRFVSAPTAADLVGLKPGEIPPKVEQAETAQESPFPVVRYVGYVQNKKTIIALIIFEGQALAVSEGDLIGPTARVVKIATGSLEVQNEEGKTRTFTLEGERK